MNVAIARWRSRWSVPAEMLARVPQIEAELLDRELELGLAECTARHVGIDEVVLVRRLSLPVALSALQSDAGVARQWGEALAHELERQLIAGQAGEVLRYPHRLAALLACSADVLRGERERDWAWQRLGWLRRDGARSLGALVQALRDEPDLVLPWLAALLQSPLRPVLAQQLDATALALLLTLVARVQQLSSTVLFDGVLAVIASPTPAPQATPTLPAGWQACWAALSADGAPARAERVLWAALIWLVAEPGLALRGIPVLLARVAALSDAGMQAGQAQLVAAAADTAAKRPSERVRAHQTASPDRETVEAALPLALAPVPASGLSSASFSESNRADTRISAPTEWGGLLFLVPLVAESGALAWLLGEDSLAGLPLAQVMHRLARQLLPGLREHDPAALAFAGWQPDFRPLAQPWPDDADLAVAHAADLMRASLIERVPQWAGPGMLNRVCARRATVVADPGWFELRFPLSEVSLELRRAALDLDPGFVPWLGVVMRFVYE
ncbi:hypothetical protein [Chitinolyticbacter meiyuanensis]|uniref:hypothetical protein n=1 Tax=Chitinolyticbacter meiyuanensis TaxID=682798 RepID=UPI0011E599A9|nr:hypothetical protein [Chitinolyticbacter meiyuanensis]